ncbi:hypothetical protein AB0C10_15805 [Microbispora amethystogenes]|uniref:hypothetical protein n=1 Tax=Microbispora amethystogenes TaxID=1427754 RepID=UPI0033D75D9E
MFVYRNSNTGQHAELPARSARLDHLDNWLLIEADEEPSPEPVTDPAPETDPEPVTEDGIDLTVTPRPLDTDNKAAWVAYAVSCGMTPSDAKSLSKAALIQEFGEENGNGED